MILFQWGKWSCVSQAAGRVAMEPSAQKAYCASGTKTLVEKAAR